MWRAQEREPTLYKGSESNAELQHGAGAESLVRSQEAQRPLKVKRFKISIQNMPRRLLGIVLSHYDFTPPKN